MPRYDGECECITTAEELNGESRLLKYKNELNLKYLFYDKVYIVHKPKFKKIKITYERVERTEITNMYVYFTENNYCFYNNSPNIFLELESAKEYAKKLLEECKIKVVNKL